ADFKIVTRQATLDAATDDGQALYRAAMALLEKNLPAKPVRLTGVSAHGLEPIEGVQTTLLPTGPTPRESLNRTLDAIASKFGSGAVTTADLAEEEEDDS